MVSTSLSVAEKFCESLRGCPEMHSAKMKDMEKSIEEM